MRATDTTVDCKIAICGNWRQFYCYTQNENIEHLKQGLVSECTVWMLSGWIVETCNSWLILAQARLSHSLQGSSHGLWTVRNHPNFKDSNLTPSTAVNLSSLNLLHINQRQEQIWSGLRCELIQTCKKNFVLPHFSSSWCLRNFWVKQRVLFVVYVGTSIMRFIFILSKLSPWIEFHNSLQVV